MKIYIFLFCMITSQAIAQTSSLKGTVIDNEGLHPIADVFVVVQETNRHSHSDIQGTFLISDLAEGNYTVEFKKLGFVSKQSTVEIKNNEVRLLNITLQRITFELQAVEIGTKRVVSAASSEVLNKLDFEYRPKNSAQDLLRVVPGLFIAQHAGGGKAEQIFVRGFDCDHGTDVATFVDGMPVNMPSHGHGQGYADLHFLIPETVERIDVFKGPYSPRFGDFATGAAVGFSTFDSLQHNLLQLETAFTPETEELTASRGLVMLQLPLKISNVSSYFAADILNNRSYFETDQKFKRFSIFSKTSFSISSHSHLHLTMGGFGSSWNASGQIPERAILSNQITRFGSIDDSEGGTTQRNNFSLTYHTQMEESEFELQVYTSDYRFRLYSNFTFFLDDPVNGDEIEQTDDRKINGVNAKFSVGHKFFNLNNKFNIGTNFRVDNITNQLWHTIDRVRLSPVAIADIYQRSSGIYASELFLIGEKLRIEAGGRFDYFIFDVEDLLPSDSSYTNYSGYNYQNLLSPKFNVSYIITSNFQLFVNAGRGFHSNDARSVVRDSNNHQLPKAFGAEIGAIGSVAKRLILTSEFWWMDMENELVYIGDAGNTESKGPSRRLGIDLSARLQLTRWLFCDLDLNIANNYFIDKLYGVKLSNEFNIPLAPTFTSAGGLTARVGNTLSASLRYRPLAERPANETNTITARPYTVFDFTMNYAQNNFLIGVIVENLLNTEWNEAQFNTESRLFDEIESVEEIHFTPGTPFVARLTLGYKF
ncbi:MAG TPA: TonB-dependent receptor [Bacteroidia bacterium]|nr:TonB-dependent receptor [Bacteroidia bacterium]